MIIKYLKDQGGQFWGAFATSLANSLREERARPLKDAMMKAQVAHTQAVADKLNMDIEQEKQRNAALNELANVLQPKATTTYEKPFAGLEQTNYGETNPPATAPDYGAKTVMKAPDVKSPEVQGALVKAQPKEAATQLLKQFGAQGGVVAYGSIADAMAAQNTPEWHAAYPTGARLVQTRNGWMWQGFGSSTPETDIYRRDVTAGKTPTEALQHRNEALYGGAGARGAGYSGGKAAQELGEPQTPYQGVQQGGGGGGTITPEVARQIENLPPGGSLRITPQGAAPVRGRPLQPGEAEAILKEANNNPDVAQQIAESRGIDVGVTPNAPPAAALKTPAGGTQIQRAAQAKREAVDLQKENKPIDVKEVGKLWRWNPKTDLPEMADPKQNYSSASAKAAGFVEPSTEIQHAARSLRPALQAFEDLKAPMRAMYTEAKTFAGRRKQELGASNLNIPLVGRLGSESQAYGIGSRTADDVEAGWLNFMQHYEGVVGGVRGASSPQLQQMMAARGPKPGMNDHQIAQRVTYINNIKEAMQAALRDAFAGKPYDGAADRAAMANPDSLKPDAAFLKATKKEY